MFICEVCHQVQPTYSKPVLIVTKVKPFGDRYGFDIKKEVKACVENNCAQVLTGKTKEGLASTASVLSLEVDKMLRANGHIFDPNATLTDEGQEVLKARKAQEERQRLAKMVESMGGGDTDDPEGGRKFRKNNFKQREGRP